MDIMIDIETLGLDPGCVVTQIAAVSFDPEGIEEYSSFERGISLESCAQVGLVIESRTLKFWAKQDQKIFRDKLNGEVALTTALLDLNLWIGAPARNEKVERIWARSAHFDFPILKEAYRRCSLISIFEEGDNFRKIHEVRTALDLMGIDVQAFPRTDYHDALADCRAQITHVRAAFARRRELTLSHALRS